MRCMIIGLAGFAFIFCSSLVAFSATPQTINYQGQLKDAAGAPLAGSWVMTFSLYDVETGGTPLWSEEHSVTVERGSFNVILGAASLHPKTLNLLFDVPYYLGVRVSGDSEMFPRHLLTSTGYALRAAIAESVTAGAVTTQALANGAITLQKLADVCQVGDHLVKTMNGWQCSS